MDAPGIATALAAAKARAVAAESPGSTVIGADQILECGGEILHQVDDMAAAAERLRALRGRTHQLHAGLALARDGRILWSQAESASLSMRDFSEEELEATLALEGELVLSSVGCYRLEGPSIRLFDRLEGDYFAILGLPMLPLLAALRQHAPDLL